MKLISTMICIFALALFTAPPSLARVEEPLFGVSWRPDLCVDGSPGMQICSNINGVVYNIGQTAFEDAFNSSCSTRECYVVFFSDTFNSRIQSGCTMDFAGGHDELDSWCVDLSNIIARHIIDTVWPDPNECTGACFAMHRNRKLIL